MNAADVQLDMSDHYLYLNSFCYFTWYLLNHLPLPRIQRLHIYMYMYNHNYLRVVCGADGNLLRLTAIRIPFAAHNPQVLRSTLHPGSTTNEFSSHWSPPLVHIHLHTQDLNLGPYAWS